MENLDAQAETVRSARAIAGDKPIAVSPITLRRRVNFHAAGDPPPTPPGELPDSVDVRQAALFGAAWTAGSVKYLSEAGAAVGHVLRDHWLARRRGAGRRPRAAGALRLTRR